MCCWCPSSLGAMRSTIFTIALVFTAVQARAVVATKKRSQRLQRETNFWASAAAGGAAACTATVAFHPVDTIKTVLQSGAAGGAGLTAVRALGARGLYRGVLPAAFSMMPACAVRMGAYEVLKTTLLQHAPRELPPGALVFLASALSVVASSSVRAPLDMIKTKVQADASTSAAKAMRAAWGGGVGALYRGAGLGLMRDVPFFGCNLLIYEQLKAAAVEEKLRAQRRRCDRLLASGTASVGAPGGVLGCCEEDGVAAAGASTPLLSPLELVLIGAAAQCVARRPNDREPSRPTRLHASRPRVTMLMLLRVALSAGASPGYSPTQPTCSRRACSLAPPPASAPRCSSV